MWSWLRDSDIDWHVLWFVLGLGLLALGGYFLQSGFSREDWAEARAHVLQVEVACTMRARSFTGRYNRPAQRVVIDCADVAEFRKNNSGSQWSVERRYATQLRIVGPVGTAVTNAVLHEGDVRGTLSVGSSFTVAQSPRDPAAFVFPQRGISEIGAGASIAGLGIFVLILAFFFT